MQKVLVLGEDTKSFLTVIRSLGRRKLQVHVAWCSDDSPATRSRYIFKIHAITPYSPDNDSWKHELIALMQRENFSLVIPTNDVSILPLQANRSEFQNIGLIYLLHDKTFEIVNNKFRTNELARSLGIPVPREVLASDSPVILDSIISEFGFPLIIKPQASFDKNDTVNKNYVRRIDKPEELSVLLESKSARNTFSIQENFIGTGVGVEVLAKNGEILFAFQHARIHELPEGSASSYRKSTPVNVSLLDASKKLIGILDYTGVAMLEFRVNNKTGEWVFIEINPRFWGSLPLAVASGADFPFYLYQLLIEKKRDFTKKYITGIYCRNLSADISVLRRNFSADHSDPTLITISFPQVIKEAVNIITLKERNDTFVIDDPMPGLAELASLTRNILKTIIDKLHVSFLSLPVIRSMYQRKLQKLIEKATTILFVCYGNTCRSSFAEHYSRNQAIFPEMVEVISSGYHTHSDRYNPEGAVNAANLMGVDLDEHRASILDDELINRAQIIFTFDKKDKKLLSRQYPFAKSKLYHLGFLAQRGPIIIKDPWLGDISEVKAAYRTIASILDSYSSKTY